MADASRKHQHTILPLEVNGIAFKAHGLDVLRPMSFTVRANERLAILGPNGAGKSTLLRLLGGLLAPSSGYLRWSAQADKSARGQRAMVFQSPVMLRRSVLDNAALGVELLGRRDARERARAALARVGLGSLAARPARLCSGGERQRIALARAWALEPQVLFLDEPTASLDPAATRAIESALLAMHAQGATLVLTTHDLHQARRLAERVMFLHDGRLLELTDADSFFSHPVSHEAKAFIRGELT
jgi:tungstate transport system ATP-binding protein